MFISNSFFQEYIILNDGNFTESSRELTKKEVRDETVEIFDETQDFLVRERNELIAMKLEARKKYLEEQQKKNL